MSEVLQDQKNISEFFTVSVEFCAFLSKAEKFTRVEFVDKSIKLLSLLYLKASVISDVDNDSEGFIEDYVSEDEYNKIHASVVDLLGDAEAYYDIHEGTSYELGETVNVSISESFADIYQDVMNFVQQFSDFADEDRMLAVSECVRLFKEFWGVRAARLISELHVIRYSDAFNDALNITQKSTDRTKQGQQNILN